MALTKVTRKKYQADLHEGPAGTTLIAITSHDVTIVHDGGGRRRWSDPDDGTGNYQVLAKLTMKQAGSLLISLADAVAFVATEEHDAAHPDPDNA